MRQLDAQLAPLALMGLPMPTGLVGSTEALATLVAFERLVSRMRSDMLGQVAALSKRFSATWIRANERLATCMDSPVNRQRSGYAECFATARMIADVRSF